MARRRISADSEARDRTEVETLELQIAGVLLDVVIQIEGSIPTLHANVPGEEVHRIQIEIDVSARVVLDRQLQPGQLTSDRQVLRDVDAPDGADGGDGHLH